MVEGKGIATAFFTAALVCFPASLFLPIPAESGPSYRGCENHIGRYLRRGLKRARLPSAKRDRVARCIARLLVKDFSRDRCRCGTRLQAVRCLREAVSDRNVDPTRYALAKAGMCGLDTSGIEKRFGKEIQEIRRKLGF